MLRLAHLTGVHIPRGSKQRWLNRWTDAAAQVLAQQPDLVLLSGDFLDWSGKAWFWADDARSRLHWFLNHIVPETLAEKPCLFLPGSRDLSVAAAAGNHDTLHDRLFEKNTPLVTGWLDPIKNIHVHAVNAHDVAQLLNAADRPATISRVAIPAECANLDHLHIFALHPWPTFAQGIRDAERLFETVRGYDIVLGARGMPAAEQRAPGLWLISTPAIIATDGQGFTLIDVDSLGSFKLHTVMRVGRRWSGPHLIASRDYEETRTRRWRQPGLQGLSADIIDVHIAKYAHGSAYEQSLQDRCGDIAVTITLHQPKAPKDDTSQAPAHSLRFPFPLVTLSGYKGAQWRAIQARIVGGTSLNINDDDTITIPSSESRDIEITGVVLNALPSAPGDWKRMRVSQGHEFPLFFIQPSMAARFLRVRIDWERLRPLSLKAYRSGDRLVDEDVFAAARDERALGRQEVMIFRPVVGIAYAISDDVDPLADTQASKQPFRVLEWQRTIGELRGQTFAPITRHNIQEALDALRRHFIAVAEHLQPEVQSHEDITVDLLCIYPELEVVMTDSPTAARRQLPRRKSKGIRFAWGEGVAGRALRLMSAYRWSRTEREGPESTLPADNWYHRHRDISVHAHVYCHPVLTYEGDEAYAIAMLSVATYSPDSGLDAVMRQLDAQTDTLDVRGVLNRAVKNFETILDAELRRHQREKSAGATDDTAD